MKTALRAALFFLGVLVAGTTQAVVIEPGVADAEYLVAASEFPPLVDLTDKGGQGVLIAKRWVITAAHATLGYQLKQVWVGGRWRGVARVIRYPDFHMPDDRPSGDAAPLMAAFEALHDVALIELVEPVEDVEPATLYRGSDEQGKQVKIYGKGATGNGAVGEYPGSPMHGKLRRANNRIIAAHDQWLDYRFDCGPTALPQEGVFGNGDSGGPVLIQVGDRWELAGLSDWRHLQGDLAKIKRGVCGQVFSNSRISYYAPWIDSVMKSSGQSPETRPQ